jgi:N-acetylmuramoyl-L-alanine amidase
MAKKIVLDAGHGLCTAGKQTPDHIHEWELNNKVALAVARQLADYDVEIYRTDDTTGKTDVSLYDRVAKANQIMPDVLVSIHHNAYTGNWGNHTGVEAYYNLNRKNDFEKTLATEMAAAISANTGLKNRGAKTAAFYMLTANAKIPSVLTEGGFMDRSISHKNRQRYTY